MDENNHQDQLNRGPWYNTDIFSRLHESLFEDFITHARTDRYNLMCYLVARDKNITAYEDDESSIEDRLIPKNVTTEAVEAFGATQNFIDIWLNCLKRIMTLEV